MKRRWMRCRALLVLSTLALLLARLGGEGAPIAQAGASRAYLPLVFGPATANEVVPPYQGQFQYGLNPGYYGNGWDDSAIYQLCHDAGCRATRNTLPDSFLATWGPTIRLDLFAHISQDLGFDEITTFLQDPRPAWRDTTSYAGKQSRLWQGMYEPIWDGGANGTPVNDANRFALYLWQVVEHYGPYIAFYEIINEPDFTYSSYGWAPRGQSGNWWENVPQPGDLPNLQAPIYHYIRLLRIAYSVIKAYNPAAYVTPGGLGYASFLDALLRYTDNPLDGSVSSAYPLRGGAYFDVLSFHNYPQYATRHWDGAQWVPDRHSDKAVEVLLDAADGFRAVLAQHGYDGTAYPAKPVILTELNVARREIGGLLGGEALQRNFTIKALVKAQQHDIEQIYWYATGETKNADDPTADSFNLMGFYENLKRDPPGQQKLTQQGVANRTTFQQLYGWQFDAAATSALALPPGADGAAFSRGGARRYVLWARTSVDRSEQASATVNLPGTYDAVAWNGSTQAVSGARLQLSGAPLFLTLRP